MWLNGSRLAVRQAASSNRVEKSSSGLPYVKVIWAGLERLSPENSTASLELKVGIQNNESPSRKCITLPSHSGLVRSRMTGRRWSWPAWWGTPSRSK